MISYYIKQHSAQCFSRMDDGLILLSIHILSVQDYRYDALQKAVMG